jgi:L-alanine-DL-glutamate epimerase-like enolase superfamily enzyme
VVRDRPGEVPWPAQRVPTVPIAVDPDGDVAVPRGHGLGIALDDELLAAYTAATSAVS